MSNTVRQRDTVAAMLEALSKAAETSGQLMDPGTQAGPSSSPTAQPQEGSMSATEGARGAEFNADLKTLPLTNLPGLASHDAAAANSTDIPSPGEPAKNSPTGEDPGSEMASTKKELTDPGYQGGQTSAPSAYEEKSAKAIFADLRKAAGSLLQTLNAVANDTPAAEATAEPVVNPTKSGAAETPAEVSGEAVKAGAEAADAALAFLGDPQVKAAMATDAIAAIIADAEYGAIKTAAFLHGFQYLKKKAEDEAAEESSGGSSESKPTESAPPASEPAAPPSEPAAPPAADAALGGAEASLSPEEKQLLEELLMLGQPGAEMAPGGMGEGGGEDLSALLGGGAEMGGGEELPPEAMLDGAMAEEGVSPDAMQMALAGKSAKVMTLLSSGADPTKAARMLTTLTKVARLLGGVRTRREKRAAVWQPKTAKAKRVQKAVNQFVRELVSRNA